MSEVDEIAERSSRELSESQSSEGNVFRVREQQYYCGLLNLNPDASEIQSLKLKSSKNLNNHCSEIFKIEKESVLGTFVEELEKMDYEH